MPKAIGVTYIDIEITCKLPRILIIKGIDTPKIINNDCLEKKPAFLIE